jgi:predicted phosphodiesterase
MLSEDKRLQFRSSIDKGLDEAFENTNTQVLNDDLATAKIAIFSDHHRGTRDAADDFCDCAKAYSAALGYYLEAGYTLVLLGDAEDLWECRPAPVIQRYRTNLLLEAEFLRRTNPDPTKKRYYRVYGNHDDLWRDSKAINRYFRSEMPDYPEITVTESLRLTLKGTDGEAYRFFLVHGHQGTLDSDRFGRLSRVVVRYVWRPLQRLFKFKSTQPSKSDELRSEHDIAMYKWALKNWKGGDDAKKAVLIAGHTHQPVFSSKSYVDKLKNELSELQKELERNAQIGGDGAELERKIAEKRAELEYARAEHGEGDGGGCPCYFNTGCCSFGDGDVTGIEIANGMIRLVRWPADDGRPVAKVLEPAMIRDIFKQLEQC